MKKHITYRPSVDDLYSNKIFPKKIVLDTDIFFHGTSGLNEKNIEEKGLIKESAQMDTWLLEKSIEIYHSIHNFHFIENEQKKYNPNFDPSLDLNLDKNHWRYDMSRENYALKDLNKNENRIFLAITDSKALRYASKEVAGGENLEGIHNFYLYMQKIVERKNELIAHRKIRYHEEIERMSGEGYEKHMFKELQEINYELIENWKKRAKPLFDSFKNKIKEHKYGIIYAIDISNDPLLEKTDEAYSSMNISPQRIVGKSIIPIYSGYITPDTNKYIEKLLLLK